MKYPITPAIRFLRKEGVIFEPHLYAYEEFGGTTVSTRALGVSEDQVVKTLVMEDHNRKPLIVLMDGCGEVSTKRLARYLGVKAIYPCKPEIAEKHSGYRVGGTSPFAIKKAMIVYMEERILTQPKIYINGGKRGFLISLATEDLVRALKPEMVRVAVENV